MSHVQFSFKNVIFAISTGFQLTVAVWVAMLECGGMLLWIEVFCEHTPKHTCTFTHAIGLR